jgi:hypothetical protein
MTEKYLTQAGIARVSYRLMELDIFRKVGMHDLTNIDDDGCIHIDTCGQNVAIQLDRNEWESLTERVAVSMRREAF